MRVNKVTNIADAYLDAFKQCMEWTSEAESLEELESKLDSQIVAMLNGWSTLSTPRDIERWDNENY